MIYQIKDVTTVILAGGKSRRMQGNNKALLKLNNKPLIQHVLNRITLQTAAQIISANQDLQTFRQFSPCVVHDQDTNFQGPLSGLLSCHDYIKTELVLTLPCDMPFIPENLVTELLKSYNQGTNQICVVHDGSQMQNLIMLFSRVLLSDLKQFFQEGHRRVSDWITQYDFQCVDFSNQAGCFININTPDELNKLQQNP